MTKNAWITIVVIVVIILLGWMIYGSMNKNIEGDGTATTTTTGENVIINNFPADGATASSGATGLVSSPLPVQTKTEAFTITARNYSFDVGNITVKEGDTVNLTLVDANGTHNLNVDGYNVGTRMLNTGESQTISFVANKLGDFEYYCSVANHRAMGMKGTIHVVGR